MARRIQFEWPTIQTKVNATLLDSEKELADLLWKNVRRPIRLLCRHSISTGYEFSGEARPPRHPVSSGTQAVPLGRRKWLLTRIKPGSVTYGVVGGYGGISIHYGTCTEPLTARGSIVARVEQEDLTDLVRAGRAVWESQYQYNELMSMIARRKNYA